MPKFTGSRLRSAGYRGFNFHLFSSITVAIALFSVFCIQYSGVAQAAPGINQQINFQGRLLNTDGSAVADGSHTVVFSLYTTSSGGSNIWTESQSVTTTKGLFRVSLGSVSSLANVDFNQDTLYLGIKVGSDLEMTPRLLFNAAPYAFMAETATLALNATTVDGLSIANGKILAINNSLTFSGTDGTTFTLPSSSGTLVSTDANQTLSNKTVNGLVASGTLTISGLTTNGGIIYTNGSGVVAQTAAGNAGQCLQSNGSGAPTWASCGDSIGPDSLNFDDFADSLTLDATTDIAIGSGLALSTSGEGSVAFNHTGDTTFASNIGLGVSDASAARLTVRGDSDAVTYGSDLITNGSFTGSSTGWTFFSGWSHDATNDEMDHTPGSATYIYQSPSKTVGSMYRVTYTLKNVSAGSLTASFGDQTDTVRTANGTYVFDARVLNTNTLDFTPSSDFNGSLDDVSVVEIISSPILALFKKSNDAAALEFRAGGTALGNSFIGISSGSSNTTGGQNTGLGYSALSSTTTGALNTSVGYHAMRINSTGSRNTGLGSFALYSNLNGSRNTGIGSDTLRNMSNGNYNTAIGSEAGYYNETGSNNVYLGRQAGYGSSGQSQTGNIFIGYQAGYNETGSNKLYIDNSNTTSPLIYGDFSANALTFNGAVTVTNGLYVSGGLMRITNPQGNTTAPTRSNNGEFAFAEVSSTARLYARINGTDVYFNSDGAGDYSEFFEKSDYLESFPTGTIATLDAGRVQKAGPSSTILGITSAFGTRNNDDNGNGTRGTDPRYVNVGLLGQLPILVSSENGPITAGDQIGMPQTVAGVGVKADQVGIARALASFNPSACTPVASLANINWPQEIRNQNTAQGRCWQLPSGIKISRIMAFIATSTVDTGTQVAGAGNKQLNTLLSAFTVNSDTISTSLDLAVSGQVTANGGLSVYGPAQFNGPALFKALAEFIDTVIFRKPVTFADHVAFSGDTVGIVKIAKGQDRAQVAFTKPYQAQPVINASLFDNKISASGLVEQIEANVCAYGDTLEECQTKMQQNLLTNAARYVVTDIGPTGFTILLDGPAAQDYTFSWSAFAAATTSQ